MKKMTYDPKADAAYAYGQADKIAQTIDVSPHINVDVSADGIIVGVEILNAKASLSSALRMELTDAQLQQVQYAFENQGGVFLQLECDGHYSSLVIPSLVPRAPD